jgi:hypothetical protein
MASILLISKQRAALRTAQSALTIAGHEVLVVDHLKSVYAQGMRRFDLALLDVDLEAIIADVRTLTRKVLLFTAGAAKLDDERVKSAGAFGFVRDLGPKGLVDDLTRFLAARA